MQRVQQPQLRDSDGLPRHRGDARSDLGEVAAADGRAHALAELRRGAEHDAASVAAVDARDGAARRLARKLAQHFDDAVRVGAVEHHRLAELEGPLELGVTAHNLTNERVAGLDPVGARRDGLPQRGVLADAAEALEEGLAGGGEKLQ